jgi:hypothetical protein
MPPRRAASPRPTAGPARESDESLRNRGFNPFLRPDHTGDGEEFILTGFNYLHRDGSQICVTVMNAKGESFALGIRKGSPDHNKFFSAFGMDYEAWSPGVVTVSISKGTRPGTDVSFVNVASVTAR